MNYYLAQPLVRSSTYSLELRMDGKNLNIRFTSNLKIKYREFFSSKGFYSIGSF